jgi:hypothetical protein
MSLALAMAVTALPAVARAQAAGQSPSEMILGTPTNGGVLPAGGPPWPGIGNTTALGPAPQPPAGGSSSSSSTSSAIVAAPSNAPVTPLVVPDVGATTSAPSDVATPAPNAVPPTTTTTPTTPTPTTPTPPAY